MRRLVLVLVLVPVLFTGGCAWLEREWMRHDPVRRDAARALASADAHAVNGDYPAAMAAYDAYLARYPEDGGADRARAVRSLVAELLAIRAERDRLAQQETELTRQTAELTRQAAEQTAEQTRQATARDAREAELGRQAAAREAEVVRLRQELAARQAEIARLREDLEALKRTDLQMERPRR